MKLTDVLSHNPEVMSGATVFKGTRVPLSSLIENLAHGVSIDEFLEDFPTVDRDQAVATLEQLGDIARDRIREVRNRTPKSKADRIASALDAATSKAAHRFSIWTGGTMLWTAGAEFLLSAFAAVEIGEEFLGDSRVDVHPECKTSRLAEWGMVVPESVRGGRIDLAVRFDETGEIFLIEFRPNLNKDTGGKDFDRIAILVAANPPRCGGFLVGPMHQAGRNGADWLENFEAQLNTVRRRHSAVSFTRRPSTFIDLAVDERSGHTQDAVAAVVVEVAPSGC